MFHFCGVSGLGVQLPAGPIGFASLILGPWTACPRFEKSDTEAIASTSVFGESLLGVYRCDCAVSILLGDEGRFCGWWPTAFRAGRGLSTGPDPLRCLPAIVTIGNGGDCIGVVPWWGSVGYLQMWLCIGIATGWWGSHLGVLCMGVLLFVSIYIIFHVYHKFDIWMSSPHSMAIYEWDLGGGISLLFTWEIAGS